VQLILNWTAKTPIPAGKKVMVEDSATILIADP